MDGEPCKNFVFDFGDGSPPIQSSTPVVKHPVTVTAIDKYGRKGNDPKNPTKRTPPVQQN